MPLGPKLIWATGANIPTWGFQKHTLAFKDKTFTDDFLLAKVRHAAATGTRQDQNRQAVLKKIEKADIIRRSNSTWASPLHMVPKRDGSWRPCGDFRHLNTITTPDRYPLPNMQDLSDGRHGCTVFRKIDLVKGYHQVPITPC
jgi:hypothetical protein